MNINIYYGGRGLIDDPTLIAVRILQEVLEELRVHVNRYNLYEYKNTIPTLPQTLKEADGIILATTVEWYGIGGYMTSFLDACWQFGDKEKISQVYMMPVALSRTYGEREAENSLMEAWEILGGKLCTGLSGYIENAVDLEMKTEYSDVIARKAEGMYRQINQKMMRLPSSNGVIKQKVALPQSVTLSPQESEQLSQYVSDDRYVQKQKEDIRELADLFRDKMDTDSDGGEEEYIKEIRGAFKPQAGVAGSFSINIEEKKQNLVIIVSGTTISCSYGTASKPDVEMVLGRSVMEDIVAGRMTFQRAFMSGAMKSMRGDIRILYGLDQVLPFGN